MPLKNEVVCYPGVVKAAMCDRIVAMGDALEIDAATVVAQKADDYGDGLRKGRVAFFSHDPEYDFIYDGINYFTSRANDETWKFALQGLLPLQYSIYGPGHFFDWHRDTLSAPADPERPGPPPVRKLSFSLQLSEPNAYDGGDFQIRGADDTVDDTLWTRMRQRGSFIIFPSLVVHRVTPVTRGERRSLIGWVLGTPSGEDLKYDVR